MTQYKVRLTGELTFEVQVTASDAEEAVAEARALDLLKLLQDRGVQPVSIARGRSFEAVVFWPSDQYRYFEGRDS